MSALDRLAERMFGRQRLETTAAMASVDTQTYIGVATSDSADGSVSVVLSDDVTQPDNGIWDGETFLASDELGTSVELPTTTAAKKGDRVLVTASGANVMATPVVTGVVGRGDEQQAQIDAAAEAAASVEGIAQEALDVAEATGQHFWSDTDGIHVTEVTEEEWNDSTGTSYHSGQNVLVNALGQLFRKGVDNLMALVAGDTYTESFTLPLHETYEWYPTFTLQHAPSRIISAQVGSTTLADGCLFTDGSTLTWTGKVPLGPGEPGLWGQTLTVTYAISPSLSLWDGLGNVVASFGARVTSLASGMTGSEPGAGEVSFFEGISRLRAEHRPSYDPTGAFTRQSDKIALLIDTEDQRAGKSGSATSGVIARTQFDDSETLSEVTLDIQAFAPDGSSIPTYEEPFFGIRSIATDNQGGKTQVVMAAHELLAISSASGGNSETMTMNQAIQALNCRSNSNGWVNSDGYANVNRAIYVGARVNNSSSAVNGHDVSLYLGPAGFNLYDATADRTLWNFGLNNPHFAVWAGTKVLTVSNASTFVLFTKAQLQAIVGTSWTPTGGNCSVFVMNGDYGASANMMSASINSSSEVRVHMNAARNGVLRVNYLIIRFA